LATTALLATSGDRIIGTPDCRCVSLAVAYFVDDEAARLERDVEQFWDFRCSDL
jgi:hypothetical protein